MRRYLRIAWNLCGIAIVFILGMVTWGMLLWFVCGAARVWY